MLTGCFGVLIFLLDLYIIFLIITGRASILSKLIWIVLVLLLPVIGAVAYLLVGRGSSIA